MSFAAQLIHLKAKVVSSINSSVVNKAVRLGKTADLKETNTNWDRAKGLRK